MTALNSTPSPAEHEHHHSSDDVHTNDETTSPSSDSFSDILPPEYIGQAPPPSDGNFCACNESEEKWAGAGAAAAPAAASGIVGLLGFGSQGVVAGSWAAAVQAGIGNVAAGSPFAIAQSIGAGGVLPVLGFAIGAAAGSCIVVGAGYGAYRYIQNRKTDGVREMRQAEEHCCQTLKQSKEKVHYRLIMNVEFEFRLPWST
ncbi:hypothetical protein EW146_g2980 [Bondarzewia mesenterica]|uniref:Uncharacterized protein n=1 Tax=Bondarzewia mesenterica TaxID=1095465 RepID=A0A4S4M0T8_9AGAM|nr:hypothetical protein EW146_g2980 [Bondarzewia mesenterica]